VEPGATHHLVLQDDVVVGPTFKEQVRTIIEQQPEAVVALFAEWGSKQGQICRMGATLGASYVRNTDYFLPAAGIVMPSVAALEYASYLRDRVHSGEQRDAVHVLDFAKLTGLDVLIAMPNVIQHDTPYRMGNSLLPNSDFKGPRRATCFVGDLKSWSTRMRSGGVMDVPNAFPYYSWHDATGYVCERSAEDGAWREETFVGSWLNDSVPSFDPTETLRWSASARLADIIGPAAIRDASLVAYATGVLCAGMEHLGAVSEELVNRSMSTILPGGLRRLLPDQALKVAQEESGQLLVDMLSAGLLQGRGT
jgi:hypothetical protein